MSVSNFRLELSTEQLASKLGWILTEKSEHRLVFSKSEFQIQLRLFDDHNHQLELINKCTKASLSSKKWSQMGTNEMLDITGQTTNRDINCSIRLQMLKNCFYLDF